jgi:hypothetical protein
LMVIDATCSCFVATIFDHNKPFFIKKETFQVPRSDVMMSWQRENQDGYNFCFLIEICEDSRCHIEGTTWPCLWIFQILSLLNVMPSTTLALVC